MTMDRACERSRARTLVASNTRTTVIRRKFSIIHLRGRWNWRAFCGAPCGIVKLGSEMPEVSDDQDNEFSREDKDQKALAATGAAQIFSQISFQFVHVRGASGAQLERRFLHQPGRSSREH